MGSSLGCQWSSSAEGGPLPKIVYFEAWGRADPIRMLLSFKGIPYVNEYIKRPDWPALRETVEFHGLPYVEVNGMKLGQTNAVLREAGAKYGLYDLNNSKEMYMADSAADIYNDIFGGLASCVLGGGTEEEKMAKVQALFAGLLTKSFVFLENRLTKTKWTYIGASDHLTYADFMWAAFYCNTVVNKTFPLSPML